MLDRYNVTMGFYEPAIFHLHTRGEGKLRNMDYWCTEQKSTFLHEYIHFLQDITTIQGLNNFFIRGEYIRYVTQKVKQSSTKEISVPLNPFEAGHNVDQNWMAHCITMGTTTPVETAVAYSKKHLGYLVDYNDDKRIPLNVINIECKTWEQKKIEVTLGTIHMMEGMAKLIQELVYPTPKRQSPYNPYYIAHDVANMIIPGLSAEPYTMIALFDLALQSSNPGWAFVDYLEKKAAIGYNSKSLTADIIYTDLKNYVMNISSLGHLPFQDAYQLFVNGAEDVMTEYLGGVWVWKNIDRWFKTIIRRGRDLRFNNPILFQLLAKEGDIATNKIFIQVLKEFGTPVVTNSIHNFDFISPQNVYVVMRELINVYAMMQIHQVFLSNGKFTCPLKKYCQNKLCGINKHWVNKTCVKQPWMRMQKWNRSYFSTWWYFKGFKDVRSIN